MSNRGDDVMVAYPLFQGEDGGSIPTSPLQFTIQEVPIPAAIAMNRKWHSRLPEYRVGCRPKQHAWVCYGAEFQGRYFAVAIWSHPNNRFMDDGRTLELRRMAISQEAPKNTASRMISVMTKLIRKADSSIVRLISYQDTESHRGTIYKAAGWTPAASNDAMDYSFGGQRSRPKQEHMAKKVRWEFIMGIAKRLDEAVDDKKVTAAEADAVLAKMPKADQEKLVDKKGQGLLFAAGPVKVRKHK